MVGWQDRLQGSTAAGNAGGTARPGVGGCAPVMRCTKRCTLGRRVTCPTSATCVMRRGGGAHCPPAGCCALLLSLPPAPGDAPAPGRPGTASDGRTAHSMNSASPSASSTFAMSWKSSDVSSSNRCVVSASAAPPPGRATSATSARASAILAVSAAAIAHSRWPALPPSPLPLPLPLPLLRAAASAASQSARRASMSLPPSAASPAVPSTSMIPSNA